VTDRTSKAYQYINENVDINDPHTHPHAQIPSLRYFLGPRHHWPSRPHSRTSGVFRIRQRGAMASARSASL